MYGDVILIFGKSMFYLLKEDYTYIRGKGGGLGFRVVKTIASS